MKKCSNCGYEIQYDAKFCPECGSKLEEIAPVDEFHSKAKIENGVLKSYRGNEEHVVIPGDVKVINYEAFVNSGHKSITLSSGVEKIKDRAFRTPGLKTIYISDTVKEINCNAFGILRNNATLSYPYFGCIDLEEIIVDPNNPYYKSIDGDLYSKDGRVLVRVAPGKKKDVIIIPEGVVKVAGSASLYYPEGLNKIVLPSTFGEDEFIFFMPNIEYETGRTIEIEIDSRNSQYKVENQVVYSKDGERLVMYNSTKPENSFIVPNTVSIIDPCAFDNAQRLEYVIISNGIKEIGEMAFSGCEKLTSVVIPNSVNEIGSSAFEYCENLNNVSFPSGIKVIPAHSFLGCGISNLVIPTTVEIIDDYAFSENFELDEITIPSSVKTIGEGAFSECGNLSTIVLSEGLKTIGDAAFASTDINTIKIPSSVEEIGEEAFDCCTNLETIFVAKGKKYDNLPEDINVIEY